MPNITQPVIVTACVQCQPMVGLSLGMSISPKCQAQNSGSILIDKLNNQMRLIHSTGETEFNFLQCVVTVNHRSREELSIVAQFLDGPRDSSPKRLLSSAPGSRTLVRLGWYQANASAALCYVCGSLATTPGRHKV